LSLLKLPEEVQALIRDRKLEQSLALLLTQLADYPDVQIVLGTRAASAGLGYRELRQLVEREKEKGQGSKPTPKRRSPLPRNAVIAEKALSERVGADCKIRVTPTGRVTVAFSGNAGAKEVLAKLRSLVA